MIKEHIADVKYRRHTRSAVCEHSQERSRHNISFDKLQILAKEATVNAIKAVVLD